LTLSRIKVENFRCIKTADLNLAPLTILYGENGTGKSSIIEGIQLLKQSVNRPINLNGRDINQPGHIIGQNFGEYYDIVRNNDEESWITFEIETKLTQFESSQLLAFNSFSRHLLERINSAGTRVSFRNREIKQSILLNSQILETVEYIQVSPTGTRFHVTYPETLIDKPTKRTGDEFLNADNFRVATGHEEINAIGELSASVIEILQMSLLKTYLLSASRGEVPRTGFAKITPEWVGTKGENIVELLSLLYSLSRPEYSGIVGKIKLWAERFQIKELYAGWIGKEELKATFRDPKLPKARPNLSDAGRGSRQILPVIIQIFFSEIGSTLMVEEPEASLHFGLLIDLMRLFGEAIKENKQIIVTTHNPDIPSILKRCVRSKILKVKDIAIYELRKSKEGSSAKRLPITKEGIIKGFIPSITKAEEKLLEIG